MPQFDDIAASLGNVNFIVAIYKVHRCVCQLSHEEEPFPKQFSSNLSKIHKDPYQRAQCNLLYGIYEFHLNFNVVNEFHFDKSTFNLRTI